MDVASGANRLGEISLAALEFQCRRARLHFHLLAPSPRSSGVRAQDGAAGGMVPHTVRQHFALERQSSLRTVARRACPTSILSGVCDSQQSRSALPKLPETEKVRPGMKATPWHLQPRT